MALGRLLGGMIRGRLFALGLLLVLVALVPLAHASPPDSTWPTGFYDDADFDEVVAAIVSESGIVTDVLICTAAADLTASALWPHPEPLDVATGFASFTIRAPPSPARSVTA